MEIKIIDAVELPSPEPTRIGKKDTMITYTVDKVRTYLIMLPAEEATETRIMEAIRKVERERVKLIGKEFEV